MFYDTQAWLDYVKGEFLVCAATADVPTKADAENKVRLGTQIVDKTGKKSYVVTAIAEDGTITKEQTGAWT